jgi:hypothetical protein
MIVVFILQSQHRVVEGMQSFIVAIIASECLLFGIKFFEIKGITSDLMRCCSLSLFLQYTKRITRK